MAKMLASGLASGVPLLIVRPNLAGILARERFRRWRRELIAGVFLTAGLASPSPDPVTMLIPGGACAVPAGAAGFPAGSRDRRRARRHPDPYPGPAGDELPPPPSAGQGQGRAVSGLSLPTRPVLTVTALV